MTTGIYAVLIFFVNLAWLLNKLRSTRISYRNGSDAPCTNLIAPSRTLNTDTHDHFLRSYR